MCIKSDNTLALGIIKNNDLALRARSLFLIIPRAWALSYTDRIYNSVMRSIVNSVMVYRVSQKNPKTIEITYC